MNNEKKKSLRFFFCIYTFSKLLLTKKYNNIILNKCYIIILINSYIIFSY